MAAASAPSSVFGIYGNVRSIDDGAKQCIWVMDSEGLPNGVPGGHFDFLRTIEVTDSDQKVFNELSEREGRNKSNAALTFDCLLCQQ